MKWIKILSMVTLGVTLSCAPNWLHQPAQAQDCSVSQWPRPSSRGQRVDVPGGISFLAPENYVLERRQVGDRTEISLYNPASYAQKQCCTRNNYRGCLVGVNPIQIAVWPARGRQIESFYNRRDTYGKIRGVRAVFGVIRSGDGDGRRVVFINPTTDYIFTASTLTDNEAYSMVLNSLNF